MPTPVSLDSHIQAKPTRLYRSAETRPPFIHRFRDSPKMASLLRRHAIGFVCREYLPLIVSAEHCDEVTTRTVTRHGDCFRVRSKAPTYDTFFVADEESLALVLINAFPFCADYEDEPVHVKLSMSSSVEICHVWWGRGPEQQDSDLRGSLKDLLPLLGKIYVTGK
jgi:hypothetical protein